MASDADQARDEAFDAVLEKFLEVFATKKPRVKDLEPISEVIAEAARVAVQHIIDNGL